jgi:predicted RNase H-like HicB family nuclease
MASATRDAPDEEGVEFIHEENGSITAKDIETGVASFGDTKAEALRMLAEAIELHEGGGEPITEEDLEEWELEDTEPGDKELPDFMQ